ncbi:hypothetical protein [Azospirillum halopraeferens]|uniref:hypothetical protein n=1 Tax=Azospirillum halopraeferens TaxID=34010 RepID=UPI0004166625|nr:hypothetical protein [Azospirillum halopraeferens]
MTAPGIHVFTSIAPNYLPKARVLARSLRRWLPEARIHLALIDAWPADLDPANEPFDEVHTLADLTAAGLAADVMPNGVHPWVFIHTLVELSTAVKGFMVERLLQRPDCARVLYFDPDIALFARPDPVLDALERHDLVLTPHACEPEETIRAIHDNELVAMRHGIFNLGFVGVANREEGRRFAAFWRHRLEHFCFDDVAAGLFTDQKWLDHAPAYFATTGVLRHPGLNVSTWNLTHRRVEGRVGGPLTVNGQPLVFYHFTGFDSGAQRVMLDLYGAGQPALDGLYAWYADACRAEGEERERARTWTYATYDDGVPVTRDERTFLRHHPDVAETFGDPFAARDPDRSYRHWYQRHRAERAAVPAPAPAPAPGAPLRRLLAALRGRTAAG